jgi:hypothetical protein
VPSIKAAASTVWEILHAAGPSAVWVIQAVRNLAMDLQDAGCRAKYLIRDRDARFPALVDEILADTGIKVVRTGIRMPRMNSIMERWIQSCRHELLDRVACHDYGTGVLPQPRDHLVAG